MFGDHWSSASGDITCLISHAASKNHVIECCNFMEWELIMVWNHLVKFGANRYSSSKDMFLACHVI